MVLLCFHCVCSENERVEIPLHDHVLHRLHGDLEQVRVGRVGVVDVDFFLGLPYQIPELVREEFLTRFDVSRLAVVVREHLVDEAFMAC